MATYNQVSYGSQGNEVRELQRLLNQNGYKLNVDGQYGAKTLQAVKDYQKKNGLDVDGIVGTNTWGALTKANTAGTQATKPSTETPSATDFTYDPFKVSDSTQAAGSKLQEVGKNKPEDFSYDEYRESDVVRQAEAMLREQLANKPGAYQSAWQTQLDETLNKILNREKFSYDLNGDALYQQYKDQYVLQGQQAMMDTMGQAQAMTGGYGNSYAQSVGQQTYQGYLQQLNDRVPELYKLALDQYNREGDDLYNQYGLYADRENLDYSRYRDQVGDYYTELDRLTNDARYQAEQDYGKYMDAYNMAYGQHRDQVSDWQNQQALAYEDYWNQYNRDYSQWADDRNFAYGQYSDDRAYDYQQLSDKIAMSQWQQEFEEAKRQFDLSYELQKKASSGSSKSSSSKSSSSGTSSKAKQQYEADRANENYAGLYPSTEEPETPTNNGFTGSTYSEAAAYLKSKGISASGLMTQSEWQRHKNGNNSAGGEHEASSYKEYLAAYIYGKTK